MAYWVDKNGKKWLYHKNKDGSYITPEDLGYISNEQADILVAQWKIDNGISHTSHGTRSMLSVYKEYLEWMREQKYSPQTIDKHMAHDVLPFVRTCPTVDDLTEQKVRAWEQILIDWRFKKGPKGNELRPLSLDTRMHRMRAIKSFIGWMVTKKILKVKPCHISIPQGRRNAGTDLAGHTKAFIAAIHPRSRLLAHLIFVGGLRMSNALQLRGEWVDHTRESIKFPREVMKNEDDLELFLPPELMDMLPKNVMGPLFPDMREWLLYYDWQKARRAIGFKGRFRIHDGRVTSASEVWRKNPGEIKLLMERHGWRDLRTALHYVKVTEETHRKAAKSITFDVILPSEDRR